MVRDFLIEQFLLIYVTFFLQLIELTENPDSCVDHYVTVIL
jgi:hypothetical protein